MLVTFESAASGDLSMFEKSAGQVLALLQRAVPLLDMLERSAQERKPVTWGAGG